MIERDAFPLNRTILELKHLHLWGRVRKIRDFKSYHFGIETSLCRTTLGDAPNFKSYHFGIETKK